MIIGPLLVGVTLMFPPDREVRMEESRIARRNRHHAIIERRRRWWNMHPLNSRAAWAALRMVGVPYVYGAEGPNGVDCSGLVQYAYSRVGKYIPRTTWAQSAATKLVRWGTSLRAGDLVFTNGGGHVGMYVGHGNVVQAEHTGTSVMVTPLAEFGAEWVTRP